MNRFLLAIVCCFFFQQVAYAQLSLPLNPELIGHNLPPSYLTINPEPGWTKNYRQLRLVYPLLGEDGINHYTLSVGTVGIPNGGTGATDQQTALDNLFHSRDSALGDIRWDDGFHCQRLPIGNEGQALSVVNGKPAWSSAVVSIPKTASVITMNESIKDLPNSSQLVGGPYGGIVLTGVSGQLQVSVDGSVLRTNVPMTAAGPLSLSNGPTIIGGQAQGLNFQGSSHKVNLSIADVGADYRYSFPDAGKDAEVVMTEGEQAIQGSKSFSDLRLQNNAITVGSRDATVTIPEATDYLLNSASPQTVRNKTFQGLTVDNAPPYLVFSQSNGKYTISAANPTGDRHYFIYDANTDGDIAVKSGKPAFGGIAYGDGNLIKFSEPGTAGLPLITGYDMVPVFDVLKQQGGGTGMSTYKPGDLLIAGPDGKLTVLPLGTPGQKLTITNKGVQWQ